MRGAIGCLVLAGVALTGCTRPCKPGSIFVQLAFDAAASSADSLKIELAMSGKTLTATRKIAPGGSSGALEIDVTNYLKGARAEVTILALKGTVTVASAHSSVTLASGCSNLSLMLAALGPPDLLPPPPPDLSGYGPTVTLTQNATNRMDILFMVDNSPSMDPMQGQLKQQFAGFLAPFAALASTGYYADLHVGVVTSDYGAGDTDNLNGGCSKSPGGQKGLLQSTAAPTTPQAGCAGPVGAPFIQYAFNANGATGNLPGGATTQQALSDTFTCMASVGSRGCGFEHQLESVYAALNNQFENAGFLRDDALLAVVFFTNEDDGSAPPTSDFYNVDPAKYSLYGWGDTFRQTRFGVACGNPLAMIPYTESNGPLDNCAGMPNPTASPSFAYDVNRYIQLLTKPKAQGGIKSDPSNVVLVAIDAPETPFTIIDAAQNTGNGTPPNPGFKSCGADMAIGQQCSIRLDHSCQNQANPAFFGDPPVRLNSVVRAAQFNQIFSICGEDQTVAPDYSKALTATGNLLRARMLGNCVPNALADPKNPECDVVQSVTGGDGGAQVTSLLRCDRGAPPCWTIVPQASCAAVAPAAVAVSITRNGPAPAGATVTATCKGP